MTAKTSNSASPYTVWLICPRCDSRSRYSDDWLCGCGYMELRHGIVYAHPSKGN